MKKTFIAASCALMMLSGCSSILSKSDYAVSIASDPAGANFEVKNKSGMVIHNGMTPKTVTLNASAGFFQGERYEITMNKPGYAAQTFVLKSGLDGWYLGNLLFGGVLGILVVDPATGAMFRLDDTVALNLQPTAENQLTITTTDQLTPEQKEKLQPL